MRALLISGGLLPFKKEAFLFPFHFYRRELKEKLDLQTADFSLRDEEAEEKRLDFDLNNSGYDMLFIHRAFLGRLLYTAPDFLLEFLKKTTIQKVFFDDQDSSGMALFDLMPYLDCYVKGQTLRDTVGYKTPYCGGIVYTEYFFERYSIEKSGPRAQILADEHRAKLMTGWNFGVRESLFAQLAENNIPSPAAGSRGIDINYRIRLRSESPFGDFEHRREAQNIVLGFARSHRIIATENRLSAQDYRKELRNSKILFSPFGGGELSRNDFEAIAAGCLLIKPSMSHMITGPDLFIENETYVPVKWDLSDLKEKCLFYLMNESERTRIADNAKQAYRDYFDRRAAVEKIGEILSCLKP